MENEFAWVVIRIKWCELPPVQENAYSEKRKVKFVCQDLETAEKLAEKDSEMFPAYEFNWARYQDSSWLYGYLETPEVSHGVRYKFEKVPFVKAVG